MSAHATKQTARQGGLPPRRALLLLLLGAAVALFGPACVPELTVEGVPCPCPQGKFCCPSLATCLGPDGDCPQDYPPSSQVSCDRNTDCPTGEACQAWGLEDGSSAGPHQCRRACPERTLRCAQGEACQPAPLDGRPLGEVHIAWLCLPEQAPTGCEDLSCQRCERAGASYCDPTGQIVLGCFLAVHPSCGLSCSLVEMQRCEEATSDCQATAEGAVCTDSQVDADVCTMFPCELCPGNGPGDLFCDAGSVQTCATIDVGQDMCDSGPCACEQACTQVVVEACPSGCSEDGGAHCAP